MLSLGSRDAIKIEKTVAKRLFSYALFEVCYCVHKQHVANNMAASTSKAYTYPLDNKTVYGPITQRPCMQKIGFGSYGQVFQSHNDNHVVKQVDMYNEQDMYVKSFDLHSITELVVLKKSMFANIPKVHNVSLTANKMQIEMDNCGQTLYHFARKLNFEQRCCILPWIAYQLIKTSLQLQANGIIHNDIKSANVLVDDKLVVSLIDFGLCVFETVDANNAISISNSWGTYCICPPEMFIAGKWSTDKMMPWSIGITLCEFLFATHNFLRDYVFDEREKKLYTYYMKYENMMKSLMSTAFSNRINNGIHGLLLDSDKIPHNVVHLVSMLLTFNPKHRLSLVDALQLPIFKLYIADHSINKYSVPNIYYHQVCKALLQSKDCDTYLEYRKSCINWMYETCGRTFKLYMFPHAVSIFDRFLSTMYIHHFDYIIVACAALYISQYVRKDSALHLVSIVDRSYKIARKCNKKVVCYRDVERYIELILRELDYDLYFRTIDILLVSQGVLVQFDKICMVMVDTVPPYNNMVLLKNYRKLLEEVRTSHSNK